MKAVQVSKPGGNFEVVERPIPEPGRGQVRIKVEACGICHSDALVKEGYWPGIQYPRVPGHEIAGRVDEIGADVMMWKPGRRVGVGWHGGHCFVCDACRRGDFMLCQVEKITAITFDGGYAEYISVSENFVYSIPNIFPDEQAAPQLCAGIIGFRSLRLSGIKSGERLGFYGFGAAAHLAIQVARHWNVEVYASTRNARHRQLALDLGAAWAGGTFEEPPEKLDAAIIFAPAGEIVPAALKALRKGGKLVLGGIHMSQIPPLAYDLLYQERQIRSVANNTRQDGEDFLRVAAEIPIRTRVQMFPLHEANRALNALKNHAIQGAAVLNVRD